MTKNGTILDGCASDVRDTLALFDQVMALPRYAHLSESTVGARHLGEGQFRARLQSGRMTLRKLAASRQALEKLLQEAAA